MLFSRLRTSPIWFSLRPFSFGGAASQGQRRCYYKVLNVATTASPEEIKESYYALAKKYHPDNNPESPKLQEDMFKELSEAYSVLSDAKKRARYDNLVMGDSVTSSSFANQDAYDYWKGRSEEAK